MAYCQTTRWVTYAPYVRLTVTQASSDGDSAELQWTLEYISEPLYPAEKTSACAYTVTIGGVPVANDSYYINGVTGTKLIKSGKVTVNKTDKAQTISFGVSFAFNLTWSGVYKGTLSASNTISVAAKTSYTISYNANGGSGAPGAQTKWHGTNIVLSATRPSRDGYTFQGWGTNTSTVSYQPGDTYSSNANATLYAIWKANTYTVTYNANGGSGAPGAQTKTFNVTLTLSNVKPTRTNYNFLGWATSASATTATYQPGSSYTNNTPITLYAVWELAYVKPRIWGISVSRCNSDGAANEFGTYAKLIFNWNTDKTVKSIKVEWFSDSTTDSGSTTISASGTGAYVEKILNGNFNTEYTYTIQITVTDTIDSSYAFPLLSGTRFVMDIYREGKGIAFNKPAEIEGLCDIGFKTRFMGGLLPVVLEPETNLNDVLTPNTYIGANITEYEYANCPVSSGTFTLIVESCGEHGQVRQTFISCDDLKPQRYVRFYYLSQWFTWHWAGTEEFVLYENETGEAGTVTLKESASTYRYIEIYFKDNVGATGGYAKVWSPNGKTVCLGMQEAASSVSMLLRQTKYTISGTKITPNLSTAGYVQFVSGNTTWSSSFGTNYLRIVRVIGRA